MAPGKRQLAEQRAAELSQDAKSWEGLRKDLRDSFAPFAGRFPGERMNHDDFDTKAVVRRHGMWAAGVLASGMQQGMTSPSRPWFLLGLQDKERAGFGPNREWLERLTRIARSVIQRSGIYEGTRHLWGESGVFGDAAFGLFEDFDKLFRTRLYTAGEYCLGANYAGEHDTFYLKRSITVKAMVERYKKSVSKTVMAMYDRGDYGSLVDVHQLIEPRKERQRGKRDKLNKAFASLHWEDGGASDHMLLESGMDRFPILTAGWYRRPGDTYSHGPGAVALGDHNAMIFENRRRNQILDKMASPPLQIPSGMEEHQVENFPGGLSFVPNGTAGKVEALYDMRGVPYQHVLEEEKSLEARIDRAFYVDLFLMFNTLDRRDITAAEVYQRQSERMLNLGPVVESNAPTLDKIVDHVVTRIMEAGLMPPPPPDLAGQTIKIEYVSILAQAQRAVETAPLERVTQFIGGIAQFDPDALDKLDTDGAIDAYADAQGAPARSIRGDEEANAIREQRRQQQRQQQAVEQAGALAQAAKAAGGVDLSGDNPVSRIVQ